MQIISYAWFLFIEEIIAKLNTFTIFLKCHHWSLMNLSKSQSYNKASPKEYICTTVIRQICSYIPKTSLKTICDIESH